MSAFDRILLLATGLLAAYQVAVGIDGMKSLAILAYSLAFGVLMVAVLLLVILGYEGLDSPWVVLISTLIPLNLALGMIAEYLAALAPIFALAAVAGWIAVAATRFCESGKLGTTTLVVVHGFSGLLVFLLPFWLWFNGHVRSLYGLVGLGGGLVGVVGVLLASLRAGRPIFPAARIMKLLPAGLFTTMILFTIGMGFGQ